MLKCRVELANQHGNLADLLLKIFHVPVGLFLKPNPHVTLQIVYSISRNFGWYCGLGTIENLHGLARFVTISCTYAAW
jgi:hypothetical protein